MQSTHNICARRAGHDATDAKRPKQFDQRSTHSFKHLEFLQLHCRFFAGSLPNIPTAQQQPLRPSEPRTTYMYM